MAPTAIKRSASHRSTVTGRSTRPSRAASPTRDEPEVEPARDHFLILLLIVLALSSVGFLSFVISLAEFRPVVTVRATALLEIVNNTTETNADALVVDIHAPVEFRMKLLAVYLANEIDIESRLPIYGGVVTSGSLDGNITQQMHDRRIFTNAECDPDGDGIIDDCDITSEWKFQNQVLRWLDLVTDTDTIARSTNAYRHYIPPGSYRYVVLQTCLQNLQNASNFAFQGATMIAPVFFRTSRCFSLAAPLDDPVTVSDGDELTLTLTYKLDDTLATFKLADAATINEEYTCYTDADAGNLVCMMLPLFQPTTKRSITYPSRLGNSSITTQLPEATFLSTREQYDRFCSVKWLLRREARICLWPNSQWGVAEMVILVVLSSLIGMLVIILKSTVEYLAQTGSAPSLGWALKGESRLISKTSKLKPRPMSKSSAN